MKINRFWSKVIVVGDCLMWTGAKRKDGYGAFWSSAKVLSHRFAYKDILGVEVPELDHLCRNRACVNPEHMEPVTHIENVRRGNRVKFNQETIENIRHLYRSGIRPIELRRMYGGSRSTITRITKEAPM